jgi:diguanylate cyclase
MEIEDLQRERSIDSLTGLKNAKAIDQYMQMWLKEYPQRKITAIAIDIDHFCEVNDAYGHIVGDVVLSKVAKKISHYVSDSGLPVRVGGEEFLILLPDVDLYTAVEVAEQVRKGVEKMKFVSARSKRTLPNITVSLGTSSYRENEPLEDFIMRADNAMAQAKNAGRNRVVSESAFN